MDIYERHAGRTTILELDGPLQGASCEALRESVQRVLDAGTRQLVLDLQDVPSIDAAGIGVLVEQRLETLAYGASLRLVQARRRVLQLLWLARVDEVIETVMFGVIDCGLPGRARRPA